jgi:hypothetical protein
MRDAQVVAAGNADIRGGLENLHLRKVAAQHGHGVISGSIVHHQIARIRIIRLQEGLQALAGIFLVIPGEDDNVDEG